MTNEQKGQQMRFSDSELDLIRRTYGGNDDLLKILRKVFLPELDPTLPIHQMIDLWMTLDIKERSPEEAKIQLIARNTVIMHLEEQLRQLHILANNEPETAIEAAKKAIKDSSK